MIANMDQYKTIGIFGLRKTGQSVYKLLQKKSNIICYDEDQAARDNFINIFGNHSVHPLNQPIWNSIDLLFLSPGIPINHPLIVKCRYNNIPIKSDIDLFFIEYKKYNQHNNDIIGITGTNGKSTTTALITYILKQSGLDYPAGGNIGTAALTLPLNKKGYTLELSSFHLDLITDLRLKVAILLNITPDHLDRYSNIEDYAKSKEKILSLLVDHNACAIMGVDNAIVQAMYDKYKSSKYCIPLSTRIVQEQGVSVINNKIFDTINTKDNIIINKYETNKSLQGLHNQENIAASYATCRLFGIDAQMIVKGIETFPGLEHRIEYIGSINLGDNNIINFYNDSKATNGEAASKAIAIMGNIYWLAGGIAKHDGIKPIYPHLANINHAYFFGQDKELFAKEIQNYIPVNLCYDLFEAFSLAFKHAVHSPAAIKNILLSPAAASLDQFKNFEERGKLFKQLCMEKILL
jgi:UDP-N-acetylmuramoylalanine--D-glutamate ligase